MIIIEGMDNTGKSTLRERLCKQFPELVYVPHGPRPPKSGDSLFNELREVLNRDDIDNVIVDRFYFSELVYGPELRGKICFTPDQMMHLEEGIKLVNPLVILCNLSSEEIMETIDEREQMPGVKDHVEVLQYRFANLFSKNGMELKWLMVYNWKKDSFWSVDAIVRTYLGGISDER